MTNSLFALQELFQGPKNSQGGVYCADLSSIKLTAATSAQLHSQSKGVQGVRVILMNYECKEQCYVAKVTATV